MGNARKKINNMTDNYFTADEFNEEFDNEIDRALQVFDGMKNSGLQDYQFCTFDLDFTSNTKENLENLSSILVDSYNYTINEITEEDDIWVMRLDAKPIPLDESTMLYWAVDMYYLGYKYDCRLSGYGAIVDDPTFPDLSENKFDEYFEKGLDDYNNNNLSSAIINWTTALKINPNDPNSFYSRAIAKSDILLTNSAIADYDKAIEIAPDFVDAIVNRATLKDEKGEYENALNDYNLAISIDNNNAMAYFNRGNTLFNMGQRDSACLSWTKAKELGSEYAEERITEHCK